MRIAIVSDTHGHTGNAAAAARVLEEFDIEAVLHCGDIGSPAIPPLFDRWPTHYVLGNVDRDDDQALRTAISAAGGVLHGRWGEVEWAGLSLAWLHSDDARRFEAAIAGGRHRLVAYGHTHRAEQHWVNGTLVVNPGALYRATKHTVAVVELPTLACQHLTV